MQARCGELAVVTNGRIVILNGASSVGKSSIVEAFRARQADAGAFWWVAGIDDVLSRLGAPWVDVGWPAGPGALAATGMRIVPGEHGLLIEVGPLLRRLLRLYQRSVARVALDGIDVVVDEVVLDHVAWDDWQTHLAGLDVTWVAVRCSSDEMARRELERGDRPVGLAAAQLATVHQVATYALELDTTTTPPSESAVRLEAFLTARGIVRHDVS